MWRLCGNSKFIILIITVITSLAASSLLWNQDNSLNILDSDANGYYAYLPATFIYHDLNFSFFDEISNKHYRSPEIQTDYRNIVANQSINQYFCGTAITQLPFFFFGHLIAKISHFDPDGYSHPYRIAIALSALFYLMIGLLFLSKTLSAFNLDKWQINLTLIASLFGTNLFYYATKEPGMSHCYSFGLISCFIFYAQTYFKDHSTRDSFISCILLAIITLVRPTNFLIILMLPFLSSDLDKFKTGIRSLFKNPILLLVQLTFFLLIISIQLIIYKISTGSYFSYSYGDNGFNFLSPSFIEILFSYKKGLFLYTPIYMISFLGLVHFWRTSKFRFYSCLIYFILITYVLSSWKEWYYGGSFSSRVYIDHISFFMIMLGVSLNIFKKSVFQYFYISIIIFLTFACQVQTIQYRHGDIHWVNMDKEKYWDTFLGLKKMKRKLDKIVGPKQVPKEN